MSATMVTKRKFQAMTLPPIIRTSTADDSMAPVVAHLAQQSMVEMTVHLVCQCHAIPQTQKHTQRLTPCSITQRLNQMIIPTWIQTQNWQTRHPAASLQNFHLSDATPYIAAARASSGYVGLRHGSPHFHTDRTTLLLGWLIADLSPTESLFVTGCCWYMANPAVKSWI